MRYDINAIKKLYLFEKLNVMAHQCDLFHLPIKISSFELSLRRYRLLSDCSAANKSLEALPSHAKPDPKKMSAVKSV